LQVYTSMVIPALLCLLIISVAKDKCSFVESYYFSAKMTTIAF